MFRETHLSEILRKSENFCIFCERTKCETMLKFSPKILILLTCAITGLSFKILLLTVILKEIKPPFEAGRV